VAETVAVRRMGNHDPGPIDPRTPPRRGDGRASTVDPSGDRNERAGPVVTGVLVAGLLAGYGVAVPVGAIGALIVSLTARTSWRVGAGAALGVATADGVFALAAVLGGAALGRLIAPIATPLRWVAAAVLVGLAARTAVVALRAHRRTVTPRSGAGPRSNPGPRPGAGLSTPGRAYLGLLGLTILNPATIVYFGALVLGRRADAGLSGFSAAVFVLAAFVASASWQLLIAGGGHLVGRLVTGPTGRLVTALVSGAVIAVLAVGLIVRN
jgi:arginine exporter protein ArgO